MRVLFVTSRLPYPPHRGDRVRTFNFLKAFAERHDVHLLSFVEGAVDREEARGLEDLCSMELVTLGKTRSLLNIATHALSPLPYQALYYRSAGMRAAVAAGITSGGFDAVYTHLFRMAPFVAPTLRAVRARAPAAVLDLTDSVASEIELSIGHRPVLTRLPYRWECRKIRALERRTLPRFSEGWVISEADRRDVLSSSPGANLQVVPNGVDESLFALEPEGNGSGVVLFVGNLSVPHNIDAVESLVRGIMPAVRERVPGATLRVVGRDAGERVREVCGGAAWCDLVGFVPDLRDAYRGAAVFAAPLRFAAGVQNKMLEAMAGGVPVVTTPLGNRGLNAEAGRDVVVADIHEFADAVAGLLGEPSRHAAVGLDARRFVKENFSWSRAAERLEQIVAAKAG